MRRRDREEGAEGRGAQRHNHTPHNKKTILISHTMAAIASAASLAPKVRARARGALVVENLFPKTTEDKPAHTARLDFMDRVKKSLLLDPSVLTPPPLSQAASLRSTKAISGSRAAFVAKPLVRTT